MRIVYLSPAAVLYLHEQLLGRFGGWPGLRDEGALLAAVAPPRATFDGQPLYPGLFEKAAALLESLRMNHPFVDGNKRVAFAGTGIFLELNGWRPSAPTDAAEAFVLEVAAGKRGKEELRIWLEQNAAPVRRTRRR